MSSRERSNQSFVTGSFVHDRLSNLSYHKLSREDEIEFIKKSKLSYYDSVSSDKKAEYLGYYMEVFPGFKEKYEAANEDRKKVLLDAAIEDSLHYRNAFLSNNFRLVFVVAKSYMYFDELENLYQEGVIGMMKALEKFDFSKNVRFSTYATIWIRQAISRYVYDKSSSIRIPVFKRDLINKLERLQLEAQSKTGIKLDNITLAEELGISLDDLDDLLVAQQHMHPRSFSDPVISDEDASELGEFIASDDEDFTNIVENDMMREFLKHILDTTDLTFRERKVLDMRFGFEDGRVYTLAEIGDIFGITRERVRQIEKSILNKLRRNQKVREYYDVVSGGPYFLDDESDNYSKLLRK